MFIECKPSSGVKGAPNFWVNLACVVQIRKGFSENGAHTILMTSPLSAMAWNPEDEAQMAEEFSSALVGFLACTHLLTNYTIPVSLGTFWDVVEHYSAEGALRVPMSAFKRTKS